MLGLKLIYLAPVVSQNCQLCVRTDFCKGSIVPLPELRISSNRKFEKPSAIGHHTTVSNIV